MSPRTRTELVTHPDGSTTIQAADPNPPSPGPTRRPAREKIIQGLPRFKGQSLLSVADIAYGVGVAESTVRHHLPSLISDGYLKYTSYVRYYGLGARVR